MSAPRIDLFLVGAQRSGTTQLHGHLRRHRDLWFPEVKEQTYFSDPREHARGEDALAVFYAGRAAGARLGGAHAHALYFTDSAERLARHNPEMRLIAILRDPVSRAYSAYWYARRIGLEREATFERALDLEERRAGSTFRERAELTYVAHGHYAEQLETFDRVFGRERIFVALTDDLRADPAGLLSRILDWAGLDPAFLLDTDGADGAADATRNAASEPRHAWLQRLLAGDPERSRVRALYRRLVPDRLRYAMRRRVSEPLQRANRRPFDPPPLAEPTRRRLAEHFAPHNERLSERLGRSLASWT